MPEHTGNQRSDKTGQAHSTEPVLPLEVGIGLRHPHVHEVLETSDPTTIPWLEIHTENYLIDGGPRLDALIQIAERWPISCHGVGLSLGSAEGLDPNHLQALKTFYERFQPNMISEHVSWSVQDSIYLNDLLPLPMTEEALDVICRNIDHAQTAFGRTILVENPSTYISFAQSTIPEWEFLNEITKRTECGLLFDVNNLYVGVVNHGVDAQTYLETLDGNAIGEIHLAGHTRVEDEHGTFLIDTHSAPICDEVWALYKSVLNRFGAKPTLIEWDLDIPPLKTLLNEAEKARAILNSYGDGVSHVA